MSIAAIVMAATEGISLATTAITTFNKAMEAANTGDEDEARRLLAEARSHFSKSVEDWDSAGE